MADAMCYVLFVREQRGRVWRGQWRGPVRRLARMVISASASLTLLLQDCLGGRYPSWSDLFSCTHEAEAGESSLSGLRLQMSVTWPLNMVITEKNLQTYNKIFVFLAGVKRSLWALQSVSLQDLENLESSMLATEDLSASCLLSQVLPVDSGPVMNMYFFLWKIHSLELSKKPVSSNEVKCLPEIDDINNSFKKLSSKYLVVLIEQNNCCDGITTAKFSIRR